MNKETDRTSSPVYSLAIFGGTFNPVHYGHLRMAEEIREKGNFEKILFIPAGNPPLKRSELADALHRLKMTEIATQNNPSFLVSDREVRKKGISYALNTISELLEKYGRNCELSFILGTDAFYDFHKWHEPETLLALCHFIIISRPAYPFISLTSSEYLKDLPEEMMKKLDSGKLDTYRLKLPSKKYVYFYRLTPLGISASLIRRCLKKGKSITYLLPEAVESYIMKYNLYV
jgi:nicotinate-nucleotide adenylyltransferase